MSKWTAKYDDDQRAAIVRTFCDVRIRSAARIAAMAAAGELRAEADSDPLPAFEIPPSSVYSIARAGERRKAGKDLSPDLAKQPPRDRAHALQLRLTAIIDRELERIERQQTKRKAEQVDGEQIRKLARALRELATLPDPSERRLPRTPGHKDADGQQIDNATRDSLAGKLLAASDQSVSPSTRENTTSSTPSEREQQGRINAPGESTTTDAQPHDTDQHTHNHGDGDDDGAPGYDARAPVSGLAAAGVLVSQAP